MRTPMLPADAERRSAPRRGFRNAVAMHFPDGAYLSAKAIDISISGIGLACPVSIPENWACELRFVLTLNDRSVHQMVLSAIVAYSVMSRDVEAFKVGVKFKAISPAASRILTAFVGD